MKGRKPIPAKVKLLRGNPGKRPVREGLTGLPSTAPKPPEHLSERARREWERLRKVLAKQGLLTVLDRAALAAYCQSYGRWSEAEDALKRTPLLVKDAKGRTRENPYLAIAERSMEQMRKLMVEFGMTPSARTRMEGMMTPPDDELEKFLESRKGTFGKGHA